MSLMFAVTVLVIACNRGKGDVDEADAQPEFKAQGDESDEDQSPDDSTDRHRWVSVEVISNN